MASELITHVTDASFGDEVVSADVPVLVDYWAEWCGPCRMIAPMLDELAEGYAGRVRIAKMNVDENQQIPGQQGVRGIPTLQLWKGGQVVKTLVGVRPKAELKAMLESHV
jgi:thioredoxin 1